MPPRRRQAAGSRPGPLDVVVDAPVAASSLTISATIGSMDRPSSSIDARAPDDSAIRHNILAAGPLVLWRLIGLHVRISLSNQIFGLLKSSWASKSDWMRARPTNAAVSAAVGTALASIIANLS